MDINFQFEDQEPKESRPRPVARRSESPRLYLFTPALENFYFLMLAGCLTLFFYLGIKFRPEANQAKALDLILSFVLLNNVHTYFTYLLIGFTPEFRTLVREKILNRRWLIKFSGFVALILAASFFRAYKLKYDASLDLFFFLLLRTLIMAHATAQTQGLSLLFNKLQWPHLNRENRERLKRLEKLERILFVPLIALPILILILKTVFTMSFGPTLQILGGLIFLAGMLTILVALFYPRSPATGKKFFMLSLIFPACQSFSVLSVIMVHALHGLEYTFLSYTILKRSVYRRSLLVGFGALGVFTVLLGLNFYVRSAGHFHFAFPLGWRRPLTVLVLFSEFAHYYLDSEIFRLSDPVVRRNLAGVLKLENRPPQNLKAISRLSH